MPHLIPKDCEDCRFLITNDFLLDYLRDSPSHTAETGKPYCILYHAIIDNPSISGCQSGIIKREFE